MFTLAELKALGVVRLCVFDFLAQNRVGFYDTIIYYILYDDILQIYK